MGHDRESYIILATGISIHPSRVGWDCSYPRSFNLIYIFQSTHPVWDGTSSSTPTLTEIATFQSTHPVWDGTSDRGDAQKPWKNFNPPIPCGMGLKSASGILILMLFQSTHPVWDGTSGRSFLLGKKNISIHPSRVGWDQTKNR